MSAQTTLYISRKTAKSFISNKIHLISDECLSKLVDELLSSESYLYNTIISDDGRDDDVILSI